jgi:hypothetical protein
MMVHHLGLIPGLIFNWLYWHEAQKMEELSGEKLPGVGCLFIQLIFGTAATALGILALIAFSSALGSLFATILHR